MADLARIKGNVAKMVSMNAPENDIDRYIASEGVSLDEIRNFNLETKELNMPKRLADSEKANIDNTGALALVNHPAVRSVAALMQGAANASMNPFGYVARAAGVDTKPLEPQNDIERALERGAGTAYDTAALLTAGNKLKAIGALGGGIGKVSKAAQALLSGNVGAGTAAAASGGGLAGYANNKNAFSDFLTELAGAGGVGFVRGMASKGAAGLTGLKNILSDNKAYKALTRGAKASDKVAQQIADEAAAVFGGLNDDSIKAIERLSGRKLDINQALKNQKERYKNFIEQNGDAELVNFAPTKEELATYPALSKFNQPKQPLTQSQAQNILKKRAKQADIELGGDINHYTKRQDRTDTVRTLANTLENPDMVFRQGNKGYIVKKYDTDGKPLWDFVAKENGKIKTKFPTTENYISNQLKKPTQNVSLSGRADGLRIRSTHGLRPIADAINIPQQHIVVNEKLPRLSDYTKGLDEFQTEALTKAINQGSKMSTQAKGSMHATHRAQEVLNDMIEQSYDTSIIGQRRATTETRELMEVKNRLDQILETGGIKPYDNGMQKAKSLQASYEKGYKFNPSEVKFEHQGLKTARDKRAFLQGRIAKITDNVKDGGKPVAAGILEDQNTLKKLLPRQKFNKLMEVAGKINTDYKRLNSLAKTADNALTQYGKGLPFWRETTESKGSMIGTVLDRLQSALFSKADERLALALLNGDKNYLSKTGRIGRGAKQSGLLAARQALLSQEE